MRYDWYIKVEDEFLNSNNELTQEDLKKLINEVNVIKEKIDIYQEKILMLGKIIDYNELRKKGVSQDEIKKYYAEDNTITLKAKKHLNDQINNERDYMFGYPANMLKESSTVKYLRWIESQLYYINSCGNPYGSGNYKMVQRDIEKEIVSKIIKNLNLKVNEYWGYITSGGTEGNLWGIREGFSKYPKGKIYFSQDTHYSALKGATILPNDNYKIISSIKGKINKIELMNEILKDCNSKKNGIILLLNCGTTTLGSIDDIDYITKKLLSYKIPYYIHIDAALYGGIPNNQVSSPVGIFKKIAALEVDSISISLHKYLGIPKTNGVLLAKSKFNNKFIEYIGQEDVTLSGSRDFLPYTTLQKVSEQYERNSSCEYYKNVALFEKLLNESNINYEKGDIRGNIFVLNKPSDSICEKYQLSTFNYNNCEKAHIIIFPFHKREIIEKLVDELKCELFKTKECEKGDDK